MLPYWLDRPAEEAVDIASAAADAGFTRLWVGEMATFDAFALATAVGLRAPKLRLVVGPLALGVRSPVALALGASSVATLTGSSVDIALGASSPAIVTGWHDRPWDHLSGRMEETVAALRALWRQERAEYHGEFIDFDPVWCSPQPLQPGGPPIVFGVMGRTGIRHAAQWADGWMPVDFALADLELAITRFRAELERAGRDPAAVQISLVAMKTPDFDTLKRYRDLGIHRVNVGVAVDLWDKPEAIMPMIDRFAKLIPDLAD